MHEKIRIAPSRIPCDLCGQMIFPGEQYRIVRDEYGSMTYYEHIACPGSPAVAVEATRPTPPKVTTIFNHAHCMA